MFWQSEDVQPAVDAAVKIFGKQGNMEIGKNVLYNVSIFTPAFGKLWYGDVSMFDISAKLKELGTSINMQVSIVDEQFNNIIISN
jgi:hypothetical protein